MKDILVVYEDKACESVLQSGLHRTKYAIIESLPIDVDFYKEIKQHHPDLLLLQVDTPHNALLALLKTINQEFSIPIVLFATEARSYMVEEIVNAGVSAFVIDGLSEKRVRAILDTAVARFNSLVQIKQELKKTKLTLEERKYIDRAKALLIMKKNVSEQEAYTTIRKLAMESNKRIGQAAKDVINVLEAINH